VNDIYSAPTDRTTGIICDQTIALDGHYTSQHYPEHLRRIRLRDTETGRTLVFLTNQFGLPAATICALYKSRWQGSSGGIDRRIVMGYPPIAATARVTKFAADSPLEGRGFEPLVPPYAQRDQWR
jgi:hypothetical protein